MNGKKRSLGCSGKILRVTGIFALVIILLFTVLGLNQKIALSRTRAQYPAPGKLVRVDNHLMHINCMGRGSPTVLIDAGNGSFSVEWTPIQEQLSQKVRTCTYDRSGYGWSEPGPEPRDGNQVVSELHQLLQVAREPGPYLLVGHSLGGVHLRLYAAQYPADVAGLVLIDTANPLEISPEFRVQMQSSISRKAFFLRSAVTLIPLFLLAACQVFPSVTEGPVPTQDVGEEPPTRLLGPTPDPSTPISTLTRIIDVEPGKMLVEPAPYPTPASMVTPWKQLIDPGSIADLTWEIYQGEMLGKDKGTRWMYSFLYPAGWFVDPKATLIQSFVQNIPLAQGPTSKFVKFEIVRLTAAPMIEEGRAVDPNDLMTVEVAGERGILISVTQQPGQIRQITVVFQHLGGWLAATGYINLSTTDLAELDRFSSIVFYMLSSFMFSDKAPESPFLSPGVSVEEHELENTPQVDPLTFVPVQGSQEDILKEHEQERLKRFPDNLTMDQGRSAMWAAWKSGRLIARETWNQANDRIDVDVVFGEQTLYFAELGAPNPIQYIQGLWTYNGHWVLETVGTSRQGESQDGLEGAGSGQIIRDEGSLNEKYGYEEAFGFQLIRGKPFYFFREEGRIGFVYDGQEFMPGYSQIPHYGCCSAAEMNPIHAENMVAFFAQRDGRWYYVEIGVFN